MNDSIEEINPFQDNYKELLKVEKWDTLHREMRIDELENIIEGLQDEIIEVSLLAHDKEIQEQSYYQVKGEEPEIVRDENFNKTQDSIQKEIEEHLKTVQKDSKKDFEHIKSQVKPNVGMQFLNEYYQIGIIVLSCIIALILLKVLRALCSKNKETKQENNQTKTKKNKKKNN